jgi:hypothetical protein
VALSWIYHREQFTRIPDLDPAEALIRIRNGEIKGLVSFVAEKLGITYGRARVVGYHSEDDGVISITFDTGVDVKVIVSKNPTDALFRFYYLENTGELREFGEVNK